MLQYKKSIEETRIIFAEKKAKYRLRLGMKPIWIANTTLKKVYSDAFKLYETGHIYYGALVQANNMLFKRFIGGNCPAEIVYSTDSYYEDNPLELHAIARNLYGFKGKNNAPTDIKNVVDIITNERIYHYNTKLPMRMTDGRDVYITTIMVFRPHLPKHKICGSIFPILADPANVEHCIILPSKFWSNENRQIFIKNI